MKHIITIVLLTFTTLATHGQVAKPPKKANTIICTVTDTVDIFTQLQRALAKNGYGIQTENRNVGTITTTRKVLKGYEHIGIFYIEGNTITATGEVFTKAYIMGSWTESSGKAYYAMRGSPASNTMDQLSNLLTALGTLTYEKR